MKEQIEKLTWHQLVPQLKEILLNVGNGKSAYESWKEQPGNQGKTEEEFLESLKGLSAYEVWKQNENENKTEDEFLESLKLHFSDLTESELNQLKGEVLDYTLMTEGQKNDLALRVPTIGVVEQGNTNAVSGGEVFKTVGSKQYYGINEYVNGTEYIQELISSSITNTNLWTIGSINYTNGEITSNAGFYRTTKRYKLPKNVNFKAVFRGNSTINGLAFYDENDVFISGLTYGLTEFNFKTPNSTYDNVYLRFTVVTGVNTALLYCKTNGNQTVVDSNFFVEKNNINKVIDNELKSYGINSISINTNFVSELTNSDVNNTNLWRVGFYNDLGAVVSNANWVCTQKRYLIKKGKYTFNLNINGNAKALLLNEDGSVKHIFTAVGGNYAQTFSYDLDSDAYLVTSQNRPNTGLPDTSRLTALNTEIIKPNIVTSNNMIRDNYINTYRPKKKRPLVTIISDDGRPNNLEWFVPMLDEFGVKSTFAVVGNWTRRADLGLITNAMTSIQLRELYLKGHDIASHTWTHTDNWSTVLTLDQIEEEMSRCKVFLQNITNTEPNVFVSPYGLRTPAIDNIISKYYDANFITWTDYLNPPPLNNSFVKRVSFDAPESNIEQRWDNVLKPAIDESIATNNWLIFAIHPQYTQYYSQNPDYMARRNELRTLLQYCQDNNIEVVTAKKGYEYYKNFVNIGVRGYDSKVYQLGMDGSEYNLNYFED